MRMPDLAIRSFSAYYLQMVNGFKGTLSEREINTVISVPTMEALGDYSQAGRMAVSKLVLIKLNGGLGTGLGLDKTKSFLQIKNGFSCLDLTALQVQHLRNKYDCDIPIVFMNSFRSHNDTLELLSQYPDLCGKIPLSFLQHRIPKISQESLGPVVWKVDESLEWCPPGHGDIFAALITSGLLDRLLNCGYKYAFISNSDNLGSIVDMSTLGYFATKQISFLMEVVDRIETDRKGGHLAQSKDGKWLLRERAQCPNDEMSLFEDINYYKYFNTNNLWINLSCLRKALLQNNGFLKLPLIVNSKNTDPTDESSPAVFQLETAAGSVVSYFPDAEVILVSHSRHVPIKNCGDLLALRSDAFSLTDDFCVIPNCLKNTNTLTIRLDAHFFRSIADLESRFPYGPPSLSECQFLEIDGDVRFGRNVTIKGKVKIVAKNSSPLFIPDHTIVTSNIL